MKTAGANNVEFSPQAIASIHRSVHKLLDKQGDPNELYHYTSVGVMDSILEHARFWASNIFYLNDAEEYYIGISNLLDLCKEKSSDDKLAKEIETIVEMIRKDNGLSSEGIFSISFSGQPDNLHQWITYAKEGGVCFGLDYSLLGKLGILLDTGDDDLYDYGTVEHTIVKTAYVDDVKHLSMEELKNELSIAFENCDMPSASPSGIVTLDNFKKNKKTAQSFFRLLACYFKASAFQMEDEYRAAFLPLFVKRFPRPKINYRAMPSGVIKPYIKVEFYSREKLDRYLPINSITVGPAGNQHAVFESVVHRIKYGNQKIWNYWEKSPDKFWKNYLSYVSGTLKRYVHTHNQKVTEEVARSIYRKLWEIWRKENQKDFPYEPEETEACIKQLKVDHHITTETGAEEERILDYIKRNNYFSKEGIWISKSQIRYVF